MLSFCPTICACCAVPLVQPTLCTGYCAVSAPSCTDLDLGSVTLAYLNYLLLFHMVDQQILLKDMLDIVVLGEKPKSILSVGGVSDYPS